MIIFSMLSSNDTPIIPDVGMFASFDPVALDAACADSCNSMPAYADSVLGEELIKCGCHAHGGMVENDGDRFTNTFPTTDWRVTLEHAEKLGIGSREYEIVNVK